MSARPQRRIGALGALGALLLAAPLVAPAIARAQRPTLVFTDSIVTLGAVERPRVQVRDYAHDAAPVLRFTSSNPGILSVDEPGTEMTARRRGVASLSVTLRDPDDGRPIAWRTFRVRVVARRLAIRPPVEPLVLPGQTARLVATAQDARGNLLADVAATFTSLDPEVLRVSRRGVATAVSTGGARVRATLDLETVTTTIEVRIPPGAQPVRRAATTVARGARRPDVASDAAGERTPGFTPPRLPARQVTVTPRPAEPPTRGDSSAAEAAAPAAVVPFVPAPAAPATASAAAVLDSIVAAGAVRMAPWRWSMTAELVAARMEHEVRVDDTRENASGAALGVALGYAPRTWLSLQARFLTGTLSAAEGATEDRDVAEGDVGLAVGALPWLALQVGATARGFSSVVGKQRWSGLRTGLEARLPFIGGRAVGVVGVGVMPVVSVSGQESPSLPLLVNAGMEYRSGLVSGRLLYSVERYEFAAQSGRAEQLATLRAGLGVRLPR